MDLNSLSRRDDDTNLGDAVMTARILNLLKRRRELIAEIEEAERELRGIDRELLEKTRRTTIC